MDDDMCPICMALPKTKTVHYECIHKFCDQCPRFLNVCPVCRSNKLGALSCNLAGVMLVMVTVFALFVACENSGLNQKNLKHVKDIEEKNSLLKIEKYVIDHDRNNMKEKIKEKNKESIFGRIINLFSFTN